MYGASCRATPVLLGITISLLFVFISAKECDKSKCKGPLAYYESLKCQPIYENPEDCCAVSYDCSHLYNRSSDHCYINGKTYNIGEYLKKEDTENPCLVGCFCSKRDPEIPAKFTCAISECFGPPMREGCYRKQSLDSCCGSETVCIDENPNLATCEVDGHTYYEGQTFTPEKDKHMTCYCSKGYKGENVEPFCVKTLKFCNIELMHNNEVQSKCIPTYYYNQSPNTDCNYASRCQNSRDTIIRSVNGKSAEMPDNMQCKFGNMSLNIGDQLNQATDYSSVCMKCVCEVPPTPTCQRLSDDECDITNHPPFY